MMLLLPSQGLRARSLRHLDLMPVPPAHRTRAIPYPALQHHGLIGDRRTAALVSSDGTLDWLCLPDYSGGIPFGALLEPLPVYQCCLF